MTTRAFLTLTAVLLIVLSLQPEASAQVREVVVGITPRCPYGLTGCWGGAAEGLARLSGVTSVGNTPDGYNSTAYVYLQNRHELPNVDQWRKEFKAVTNEAYGFRGVEITVEATVIVTGGKFALRLADGSHELPLVPLTHKLQWNFKKGRARQPEPDEEQAFELLTAEAGKAEKRGLRVLVTGPLIDRDGKSALEVREFFPFKQD